MLVKLDFDWTAPGLDGRNQTESHEVRNSQDTSGRAVIMSINLHHIEHVTSTDDLFPSQIVHAGSLALDNPQATTVTKKGNEGLFELAL